MGEIVFEPVTQKDGNDCAIASLAMLLGIPYAAVREAAGRSLKKDGMSTRQIVTLAKKLGAVLVKRVDFDDNDIGLLDLTREDESDGHVVVFLKGSVWTTASGALWTDMQAYLRHHKFRLNGLLRHEN